MRTHAGIRARSSPAAQHERAGFSLIEVMVVMAVLTVAISMFLQTLASAKRLDPVAGETAIAAEAARSTLEAVRNHPMSEVFKLYDDDPANDPGGPGTAPGSRFSVAGLEPQTSRDPVGHIVFPATDGMLREDYVDADLSMPRDLDGDGVVDHANHAANWIILPVKIRLDWRSRTGKSNRRTLTFSAMFAKT